MELSQILDSEGAYMRRGHFILITVFLIILINLVLGLVMVDSNLLIRTAMNLLLILIAFLIYRLLKKGK